MIHRSGIFGGKINIDNTSENIKCGNLMKNRVIYQNEEKKGNNLSVFMVILSNKSMQNYPKNHPPKGVRVIYPDSVVMKNG